MIRAAGSGSYAQNTPVRTLRDMPAPVSDPLTEAEGEGGRLLPGQMPAVEEARPS